MREPATFEARLRDAYRRYADEVDTDVNPVALASSIAQRSVRSPSSRLRLGRVRTALMLGLLLVLGLAAAVVVGTRPSPAPVGISNGWIAFAASPLTAGLYGGDGEHRDIYLALEGTTARRIIGAEGDGRSQGCPRFSPDGSMLAYTEGDETVGKIKLDGSTPVMNRAIVVVGLGADGEPSPAVLRVSLPADPGPLRCPEWSPSGSRLAFFTGTEVWVADIASGAMGTLAVEQTRTGEPRLSLDLEWSPDSASIAVGESGLIRLLPVDGTEPTDLPVDAVHTPRALGWLAGGRQLVYLDRGVVHIVELDGGADRPLLSGAESLVVSPDGSRLAYEQGLDEDWRVVAIDGTNVISIPGMGSGLLWSPDGRRLLSRAYWSSPSVASELVTVAAVRGSPPIITPFPDVSFEWMSISHVSWQALGQ